MSGPQSIGNSRRNNAYRPGPKSYFHTEGARPTSRQPGDPALRPPSRPHAPSHFSPPLRRRPSPRHAASVRSRGANRDRDGLAGDPERPEGLGPVEGSVFALFGLLIAFTFSGAGERFDSRRRLDHRGSQRDRHRLLAARASGRGCAAATSRELSRLPGFAPRDLSPDSGSRRGRSGTGALGGLQGTRSGPMRSPRPVSKVRTWPRESSCWAHSTK